METDPRDARIRELERENAELVAQVAALKSKVKDLEAQVKEHVQKAGGRKSQHGVGPTMGPHRRPGRKPGQGLFTRRGAPTPETVTREVHAAVTEPKCPKCGGDWKRGSDTASTTELPERPRPVVTLFKVDVCECKDCGLVKRGEHPELKADQRGATAHRLGRRALAAAHVLNFGIGVPRNQVPRVMKELTGISVTASALTQDAEKSAEKELKPVYAEARSDVASGPTVNTDDTGWRIAGVPAFLMNFNNPDTSVFQIRWQHRNEEVREIISSTWAGIMGTDRFSSYDAAELINVLQQKCNGHMLRNISKAMELQTNANRWFGRDLRDIFQQGMQTWRLFRAGEMTKKLFIATGAELDEELTRLLRPRTLTDPRNQTLLDELGPHHERGNLLRYLKSPLIEPTNNTSERDLRPAVKMRKVSFCNKTDRGARTTETWLTVLMTAAKRLPGMSLIDATLRMLLTRRLPPRLPALLPAPTTS